MQLSLDNQDRREKGFRSVQPFRTQLLKWIGNKQRFAHEIISHFPTQYDTYFEPFLGSGAVLGTLAPTRAVGSETLGPLIEIWKTESFGKRVDLWHRRTAGAVFRHLDFEEAMEEPSAGDIVYCDPPYTCTQSILYRSQSFSLKLLFETIARCRDRGVRVLLSIDGTKRSGGLLCNVPIPTGLFRHEVMVNCGRSMLRRFQRAGDSLEDEVVRDRLLLTF